MQLPTFGVFPLFVKWMIECWKITFFFKSRMLNIKYCWRATFGHFLGWRGLSLALIQLCWGRYAPAGEMTRHPWEFLSNNYLHIVQLEKYAFMEYVYSACKISAIERFFCGVRNPNRGGVGRRGGHKWTSNANFATQPSLRQNTPIFIKKYMYFVVYWRMWCFHHLLRLFILVEA